MIDDMQVYIANLGKYNEENWSGTGSLFRWTKK